MKCRRCKTDNAETSRYCSACGALLTSSLVKPKRAIPGYVFAAAGAIVILVAAYLLLPGFRPSSRSAVSVGTEAGEEAPKNTPPSGTLKPEPGPSSLPIAAARFALDGAVREAPSFIETALFDGAWAALPLWAFLGSAAPRLENPGPSGLAPALVGWASPDPLVLCRFDLGAGLQTAGLAPYDGAAALEWRPLSGERTSFDIEPGPLETAGSFRTFSLFREIEAPGVLVQQGRIVGWTFGAGTANGYLWAPADGAAPQASLSAAQLSAAVRPGSREGAFVQALSLPDGISERNRLEALAAGFRGRALLQPEDLPAFLRSEAITALMASLTSSLVQRGESAEAARVLEPGLLAAAADIPLVKAAAGAYNEARGFDAAHRLLADLRREPAFRTAPAAGSLAAVEVDLAKASLHKILNERGFGGLEIFEGVARLAPADLELRLLGAEAAVLEKKWLRAEELLRDGRPYPDEFADKVRTLERLVEEGRRDEDSVTIRFSPGDKLIPVYAFLNKKYRQKFYIDTGATTTIIPLAAAAALEIRIDDSTPVVGLQGVAGGDLAYQVGLESIEIEGLTVFDLRAIVYDLGEKENAGLLGNDFLSHFQVDLDSVKGILKLRQK
jgi:hypothetical protein